MSSTAAVPPSVIVTVKLAHVFSGIFIWEFFTTLGFEWEVYRRRRPWRWSFLVYVVARVLTLAAVVDVVFGFDAQGPLDCGIWFRSTLVLSFAAIVLSSLLILLRGVAIWGHSPLVVAVTAVIWLTDVAVAIWSVQMGEAVWLPALRACAISGADRLHMGILVDLCTDVVLLSIMLAGVMNKRNGTGLWRVLYVQGLVWFLFAVCSKIPPIALGFMNIDEGWDLMFNTPHLIIIVVVATRVYRGLFMYITPTTAVRSCLPRRPNGTEAAMQVTVHKTVEVGVELMPHCATHYTARSGKDGGEATFQLVSRGEREAKEMYFNI